MTQVAVAVRARPARGEVPAGRPAVTRMGSGGAVAGPSVPRLDTEDGVRAAHRAHAGVLLHHAELSLQDRGLAEEAVQETFVRAWRHAERFDPAIASLRTWLFAILRNVVIDLARARAIRPSLSTEPDRVEVHATAAVDDDTECVLRACELAAALARLSEDQRRAIVETHLRSRSYADVAGELGVPIGTVRSRVFYGLRALRTVLEERGAA